MKITFIGCGNMGGAIIGGLVKSGIANAGDITASDPFAASREKMESEYGINTTDDNAQAVKGADVVVIAVKPQVIEKACAGLKEAIDPSTLVVSIAAGQSLAKLESLVGDDKKIVRVMPNTPALAGEGISAWCVNKHADDNDKETVKKLLGAVGEEEEVPESLMSVVTAVSGSAPAYIFMLIEAMADAAVLDGMPRKQAYHFAAQTVLGSAKLCLTTGKHPGELKDMVCSPAGTTIEGLRVLEETGFRSAVIGALHAACEKSKSLT